MASGVNLQQFEERTDQNVEVVDRDVKRKTTIIGSISPELYSSMW